MIDLLRHIRFNQENESKILIDLIINNYIDKYINNGDDEELKKLYGIIANLAINQNDLYVEQFFVNFSLVLPAKLREDYQSQFFQYSFGKKEPSYLERYMSLTDRVDALEKQDVNSYIEENLLAKAIMDRDYAAFDDLVQGETRLDLPFANNAAVDLRAKTPLQVAIQLDEDDMTMLLLNCGKDLNVNYVDPKSTEASESALSLAILKGKDSITQKLLSTEGIDISQPDHKPLIYALTSNRFDIATQLIERGEKLTSTMMRTLLQKSIVQRKHILASFLLKGDVVPDALLMKQALDMAINTHDSSILTLLYQHGGHLDSIQYENLLKHRLSKKDISGVILLLSMMPNESALLEKVLDILKGYSSDSSSLIIGMFEKLNDPNPAILRLITALASNMNNDKRTSLLLDLINKNNMNGVKILLEQADIQISENNSYRFISLALSKNFEIASLLHQHGIRLSNDETWEIFKEAIGASRVRSFKEQSYNNNILRYIITYMHDYGISEDSIIRNVLIQGQKNNQTSQMIKNLLNAGVSPQKIFEHAVNLKKMNAIETLISEGVHFELSRGVGYAALLFAVDEGQRDLVEWLLTNGVDPKQNQSEIFMKAATAKVPDPAIVDALLDMAEADLKPQILAPFSALDMYTTTGITEYAEISFKLVTKILDNDVEELERFTSENEDADVDELKLKMYQELMRTLRPEHQAAFDILLHHSLSRRKEAESSMEDSLTRQANRHFEHKVEPSFKDAFLKYPGHNDMQRVEAIEREIKAYILDAICESCNADKNEDNQKLFEFINKNRSQLLNGDEAISTKMRKLVVSNENSAQIAWRGYDQDAPHDLRFPNLLTPNTNTQQIFTTQSASPDALSIANASDIVRKRVAYYFIAEPDKNIFLSQLADMRRAHEDFPIDSPTCFPGAIGRIARMGDGHPILQLPPTRRDVILKHVNAFIIRGYTHFLETIPPNNYEKSFYALAMLTEANAKDVLADKNEFDQSLLDIRNQFNTYLKSLLLENSQMLKSIDEELAAIDEKEISDEEIKLEIEYAFTDLSGQGRSKEFYDRLQSKRKENEVPEEVSDSKPVKEREKGKEKEKVREIENPYEIQIKSLLGSALPPPMLQQQLGSKLKKYIEFEIINQIFSQEAKVNNSERVALMALTLVDEIVSSSALSVSDIVQESFEKMRLQNFDEFSALKITEEEEEFIKKQLCAKSSMNGLNKKQADILQEKIAGVFENSEKLSVSIDKVFNELRGLRRTAKRQKPLQLSRVLEQPIKTQQKEEGTLFFEPVAPSTRREHK
ncbi:ankyrin repeat domain-containing protein [Candidatus Berkiella aquae]|uniref:Ankyrin repeat domain-containing protein n=1 Tax=Candidatus Berkiella aquae TaxID=295108 RepID=A0AAE3L6Q9_9GAMM|nr:ankyrin repeat domain-containing protein [Candidatus Berkiella aquae]MCS5710523.1 ankyrin repeat domain-containing protein [Candidatus Berkiella aquae]